MSQRRWDELVEDSVNGEVSAGTMFGSRGLRTGRRFFAIWWREQLVLKLPPASTEALLAAEAAQPFEPMEGRVMNGWVVVGPDGDWTALSEQARAYVASQHV